MDYSLASNGALVLISAAIVIFVNYLIIRTAVFHAMKRHTEWTQGKRK